jgi:hypothetical protein
LRFLEDADVHDACRFPGTGRSPVAEAIADREGVKANSVRGRINHFLRVSGIKRGECISERLNVSLSMLGKNN